MCIIPLHFDGKNDNYYFVGMEVENHRNMDPMLDNVMLFVNNVSMLDIVVDRNNNLN